MKTFIIMFCIICTASLLHAQTIKQVEYFIDKDKGVGKNTKLNLAASADSSYRFNVDVSGVPEGFHKLYLRTKDSKGKWSLTCKRTIEVATSYPQNNIISGEYFFDTDPGYGKGKRITVTPHDSVIVQDFETVTSSLDAGYHKLYTRFRDTLGRWSITCKRTIEIFKTAGTTNIIAAEYFFDADKGFDKATRKTFATSSADSTFKFKIPYNKIPADADTLFIRVKDSVGDWSITKIALFTTQSLQKTDSSISEKSNAIIATKQFSIFPNPAIQTININYQLKNKSASVQIFDVNGKAVMKSIITDKSDTKINIGKLAAGEYILEINDGKTIQSAKFIKQ